MVKRAWRAMRVDVRGRRINSRCASAFSQSHISLATKRDFNSAIPRPSRTGMPYVPIQPTRFVCLSCMCRAAISRIHSLVLLSWTSRPRIKPAGS